MKITVLDGYAANPGDLSWDGLREFGELSVYPRLSPEEVLEKAADSEILLTNKVQFTAEVLSKLPRLRYLGILATGYNTVDLDAAAACGVTVTNIPAYSTDSVVQSAFALILAITNRVEHYTSLNRNGRWSSNPDFCYWDTPLMELAGKTIGIVGLGNIGLRVAQLSRGFGMDVFAMTSKDASSLPDGIQKTTLEGLLAVSDIVSLHCPLTDSSRNMINSRTLSCMKPGAILINTGRGPLVDEQAVADALQSGKLGAYGADVLCEEPPVSGSPLLSAPNAFITPHIAWATVEARSRLLRAAVENVRAFLSGKPQNVVSKH